MRVARVREAVTDLIEGMHPGDPLPSERDLAAQMATSRTTLRKAIEELAAAGRVVRRHGVGTFVAGPKLAQTLSATSFTEDMLARGFEPGARTLSARTRPAGAVLGRRLQVSPEAEVLQVHRLRLADREPMSMEELHVPTALVPGLTGEDLAGHSFYALLEQRYGVRIASGLQTLEPTVTSSEEAELLGVPAHSPAFLFERTSRSEDDRVVEFVRSVYRGDRYRIVAEIAPRGAVAPTRCRAEAP